jgi:osmotically-inducible protein OsmY
MNVRTAGPTRRLACAALVLGSLQALVACAPLLVGGAVVGGFVALDRRTSGAQLEDQAIELKAMTRVREVVGDSAHVSVTSYNRLALITGEVASANDSAAVEQAVRQIDNVRAIVNELAVTEASSIGSRSNDLILASKVKASFIDAPELHANAFKVVTERGTVYLMGRVTEREASRATEVARSVNGVQKVVRVFEVISEEELARSQPDAKR